MGAAAVPGLLALLAERASAPGVIRAALVNALGNARDPRAVPALVSALCDPDEEVRGCAAKGLGMIGGEGVVPALRAALSDPGDTWFSRPACSIYFPNRFRV